MGNFIRVCKLSAILLVVVTSIASSAQVSVVVSFGPPALPIYEQPPCPAEGYLWTPGYWAYDNDDNDYYWVPGTWVLAPEVGFLWTPGFWAWNGTGFVFHDGYWGPQVGFYGGIDYGFGYYGEGYRGGRWDGDRFFYNRAVNNVNATVIHNIYNTTVIHDTTVDRVSYNGGSGGVIARPTPQDEAAAHAKHLPPDRAQLQHVQAARGIPELRASANHGKPPIAATPESATLKGPGVVPAKAAGTPYHPPANRAVARPAANTPATRVENATPESTAPVHAKHLPPHPQVTPANTGSVQADRQYQHEQRKLNAQQEQERQKLQQQQGRDHQQLAQPQANQAPVQQMETKHQQQTRQLQQQDAQQQQALQQKQQASNRNQTKPPKQP
jgi:WXXGXW repeat (2 copies)